MNIALRRATKQDAALVAEISRQTFYDTFAADNTEADMQKFLNEQFTKGRLMLEVGAKENDFLLAYVDDTVAGYAKLRDGKVPDTLKPFNCLEIARLYALKSFIGHGVGAALMQGCLNEAAQREKEFIWLGVWEKNRRAIDFYARWGFEKFGEWEFLLGDDLQHDWLMRKELKPEG